MNDNLTTDQAEAVHAAQVDAIAKSVYEMVEAFAPKGFTPETIFEGAIKGAIVAMMMGRGLNKFEVADMLADFSTGLRAIEDPKRGNLHVVE